MKESTSTAAALSAHQPQKSWIEEGGERREGGVEATVKEQNRRPRGSRRAESTTSLVEAKSPAQSSNAALVFSEVLSLAPGVYHYSDIHDVGQLVEDNHRVVEEDDKDFIRLRDSVLMSGVKEEIHLYLDRPQGRDPQLTIVAGHRRTRVIRSLREVGKYEALPAKLTIPATGEDRAANINRYATAAVTNMVHKKLTGIERAWAIKDLLSSGMRIDQVVLSAGVNRKVVERSNNLNLLPEEAQDFAFKNSKNLREKRLWAIALAYKKGKNDLLLSGRTLDEKGLKKAETELKEKLLQELKEECLASCSAEGEPGEKAKKYSSTSTNVKSLVAGQRIIDDKLLTEKLEEELPLKFLQSVLAAIDSSTLEKG